MADNAPNEHVSAVMRQINQAWIAGRVDDLAPFLHPKIVMVVPGFSGRIQGRESFLAGFRDFSQNSRILEFNEIDQQVDVVGETAVVSFRYEMVYEQNAKSSRAVGRDVWVFEKQESAWLAVWRTMLETEERPA
jgi:ketosteroid isomerase-like protein